MKKVSTCLNQRKLDRLSDLLLLAIEAADIAVFHRRLFMIAHHRYGGIGFRREDVNESIGMTMQGNG